MEPVKKDSITKKRKEKSCLPYRYFIIFLLGICAVIAYGTRVSFKLSLRHMTMYMAINKNRHPPGCGDHIPQNFTYIPVTQKFFKWPRKYLPTFSDIFIYSYIFAHFPAGIVSVKNGGKTLLTGSLLTLWTFTVCTPSILLHVTDSGYYVFFYRAVAGASCGAVFPCFNSLLSNWTPAQDRGKMGSIIYAGNSLATGINLLVGNALIVQTNTWSCVYYFYGSFLLVWLILWHRYGSSYYQHNFRVSTKELRFLDRKMNAVITFRPKTIPWWQMLKSLPLWVLTINEFSHQFIFRLISKELPNYLRESLGIETNRAYVLSSIPFLLLGFFTIVNGFLSDFIINREYVHTTTVRKICTTLGGIGPCMNFVTAYYAGCNEKTAIFILFFGICLMSFYYAGTRVNTLDLAPNFSGLVMGISSGVGSLSGVFTMIMIQTFNLRNNLTGWKNLFWTSLALLAASNLLFSLFGTGEVQEWNHVPDERDEQEETEEEVLTRPNIPPLQFAYYGQPRAEPRVDPRSSTRIRMAN